MEKDHLEAYAGCAAHPTNTTTQAATHKRMCNFSSPGPAIGSNSSRSAKQASKLIRPFSSNIFSPLSYILQVIGGRKNVPLKHIDSKILSTFPAI